MHVLKNRAIQSKLGKRIICRLGLFMWYWVWHENFFSVAMSRALGARRPTSRAIDTPARSHCRRVAVARRLVSGSALRVSFRWLVINTVNVETATASACGGVSTAFDLQFVKQ